tara:strand:- start:365 stop:637 length:273 start_codon:yes stop_codon:yes gene_type:complete
MKYHKFGITYYEEDRGNGPFMIRVGGTNKFITKIQTGYYSRWGTPSKSVSMESGWDNKNNLRYQTMDEALKAAKQVWDIEGVHTSIERVK